MLINISSFISRAAPCLPMYKSFMSFSVNYSRPMLSQIPVTSISRFERFTSTSSSSSSHHPDDNIASDDKIHIVALPKLSHEMTKGRLVRWLKRPGDRIELYDILMEVETEELVENVFKVIHSCMLGAPVHAPMCIATVRLPLYLVVSV